MAPGRGKACTAELLKKTAQKGLYIEVLRHILRPETVQFCKNITQSASTKIAGKNARFRLFLADRRSGCALSFLQ
jgi:hypothetical protein